MLLTTTADRIRVRSTHKSIHFGRSMNCRPLQGFSCIQSLLPLPSYVIGYESYYSSVPRLTGNGGDALKRWSQG